MMCWASCGEHRLLCWVLSGQNGLKMHVKIAIGLYYKMVWFAIRGGMVLGPMWYLSMMHYGSSWSKCIMIPRLEVILGCIIPWVRCICIIGGLVYKVMSVGISDIAWFVSKLRLWLRNHRGFCSQCLSRSMPFLMWLPIWLRGYQRLSIAIMPLWCLYATLVSMLTSWHITARLLRRSMPTCFCSMWLLIMVCQKS